MGRVGGDDQHLGQGLGSLPLAGGLRLQSLGWCEQLTCNNIPLVVPTHVCRQFSPKTLVSNSKQSARLLVKKSGAQARRDILRFREGQAKE